MISDKFTRKKVDFSNNECLMYSVLIVVSPGQYALDPIWDSLKKIIFYPLINNVSHKAFI